MLTLALGCFSPYFARMDIIIYAVIAVAIAYRLYTILGEKSGDERERPNPFSLFKADPNQKNRSIGKPQATRPNQEDTEDVLATPLHKSFGLQHENDRSHFATGPAPHSLSGTLNAIAGRDPEFIEKEFLRGARVAFEIIVQAFAASERETLKRLVSARLYAIFAGAIEARELAHERLEMKMLHLIESSITGASFKNDCAEIQVQFISDQHKIIVDKTGATNDMGVARLNDIWTFRRDLKSQDPNWTLIETKSV